MNSPQFPRSTASSTSRKHHWSITDSRSNVFSLFSRYVSAPFPTWNVKREVTEALEVESREVPKPLTCTGRGERTREAISGAPFVLAVSSSASLFSGNLLALCRARGRAGTKQKRERRIGIMKLNEVRTPLRVPAAWERSLGTLPLPRPNDRVCRR